MRVQDVERGEIWMTAGERTHLRKFVKAVRGLLARCGVEESPLLALRVADVSVHLVLVRRQERALMPDGDGNRAAAPELTGTLAEQIGKSRERLRRAVRELEDACARLGKPVEAGLAAEMLPLVRKTQDLLQARLPADKARAGNDRDARV